MKCPSREAGGNDLNQLEFDNGYTDGLAGNNKNSTSEKYDQGYKAGCQDRKIAKDQTAIEDNLET